MVGKLLNHLSKQPDMMVGIYYAHLTSILIIYENSVPNALWNMSQFTVDSKILQDQYLQGVQLAFQNLDRQRGISIVQQWINIWNMSDKDLELKMLEAVSTPIQGFISILTNTTRFLAARYYATRNAKLRYKDKYYLFLCINENPSDFLNNELLQFYPQHIMVVPKQEENKDLETKNNNTNIIHQPILSTILKWLTTNLTINFQIWTQRFVGRANINRNAVYLDTYITRLSRFQRNSTLYVNKLLNLEKRVIRLGSITYIPYVLTDYVEAGKGNVDGINLTNGERTVRFIGSEAELMRSFCQLYNCHMKVIPYGIDNWGIIFDNGTGIGMLGGLYAQHTEMAIGCIYNWYDNITETSRVIARSAVTILGPGPRPVPRWRIDLIPFTNSVWCIILMTLIVYSIVFHFVKFSDYHLQWHLKCTFKDLYLHLRTYEHTLFNTFGVFIQQPSVERINHRFVVRVCLATLLMACITLQSIYCGQLSSILTMPMYLEKVDTSEKWSLTNWRWSAPSIIWVTTIEKSDLQKEQRLTKQFVVHDHNYLYEISLSPNYGFAIERLMSDYFSFGKYITPSALETKIILKDDVYYDWTRVVAIRGWPLMEILNRHIAYCMEAGLFIHWERKMVSTHLDQQTQHILLKLSVGSQMKHPPQKLNIENISAALFILLFGCLSGFIIFIMENALHRLDLDIRQCSYKIWNSITANGDKLKSSVMESNT